MTFCIRHKTIPPREKEATTNNSTQQKRLWPTRTDTLGAPLTPIAMIGGEVTNTLVEDRPQHIGIVGNVLIKNFVLSYWMSSIVRIYQSNPDSTGHAFKVSSGWAMHWPFFDRSNPQ